MDEVVSPRGRIIRAAGLVMAAFLLSRALGLVREMVVSRQFGTSPELDAYLAAFRVPDLIYQLMAGGALGSAFIPVFTGVLARGDRETAWRLGSGVANAMGLALAACALLAALFAPTLMGRIVAPGFGPQQKALSVNLMRIMLASPVLFGLSAIAMAILNSHQHFLLPALAPCLYNLFIIGGAFLGTRIGIYGLALGVVVGAAAHLAIQFPALLRRGARYYATLELRNSELREVVRLVIPRAFGLGVVQVNFVVNTILASRLAPGSLASLNYAWMVMMLPQGIFAMALGTAAFPTLAELVAQGESRRMARVAADTLRLAFYLAIPASIAMVILRVPLIELLFERGQFTATSTRAVAWVLQFYSLGLFAHAGVEILSRAFYSLHDTRSPVGVSIAGVFLNVLLSLALVGKFSQGGLALANSLATILEMFALAFLLAKRLPGLNLGEMGIALLKIGAAGGAMGLALMGLMKATPGLPSLLLVGIGGVIGGGLYWAASWALRCPEGRALGRLLSSGGRLG